ncbi:MAG: YkvA family protein [Bacillota bacterium]
MKNTIFSLYRIIKFMKDSDVKLSKKMLFLVPIIYLIFPFDLIGDFFPLAGQLDDIAVFVVMWPILKNLLSKYDKGERDLNKSKKKDPDAIDMSREDYTVE